jgi:hypothetical protein
MSMITEERALETLCRVPDRIILAVMGREFDMSDYQTCVCGWVLREKVAELQNRAASEVDVDDLPNSVCRECAGTFGGTVGDWDDIFMGVTDGQLPAIESAFVRRVDEAYEALSKPRRRSARRG